MVISPVIAGLFISIVMENIIDRLLKCGCKRKYIVIIVYLFFAMLIGGIILFISPSLFEQIKIFIDTLPSLLTNMRLIFANYNIDIYDFVDLADIDISKIINYLSNGFSFIFSIGIAISSAFFISYDYPKVKEKVKNCIPNIIKDETIYFFSKYIPFFSKYVYSLLIDCMITFLISFFLFQVFGLNYSLIGALIIAVTNLIPYIGPILGLIPVAIIGYSISPYFALTSVIIVLIVQIIESNIVQPLIFKNVIKIHPLEGIIGVLVFSYLFSVVGMIFSPLLVVAFKLLFIEKYNKSQINGASIQ